MIKELAHASKTVAAQIYVVFQRSYQIEADLIGTSEFPPLLRSSDDIANAESTFYGFFEQDSLAAVVEITCDGKQLSIESLTVDPGHFRKGIASKLIDYVLLHSDFSHAVVETAAVNQPAIALYEKHGFVVFKKWTPDHGIEKVALQRE